MKVLNSNELETVEGGALIAGAIVLAGAGVALYNMLTDDSSSSSSGPSMSKEGTLVCGEGQELHYSSDGTTTTASCTNGGG